MGHRTRTSSTKDNWRTPPSVFKQIKKRWGPFDLDAAASVENSHCSRFFTEEDDALSHVWRGRVFVNPPYGSMIAKFVRKAHKECVTKRNCKRVVMLIPASTDTTYWHECIFPDASEIYFWKGRIRFLDGAGGKLMGPANFPSAVIVFDSERKNGSPRYDYR